MQIDFSPIDDKTMQMLEFSANYTVDELRAVTNTSIDHLLALISDLDDADVVFDPVDPEASDSFAVEGEERIGWSIAHMIAHVTASSEEGAAFASILARGIDYASDLRLRYETPWRDITTQTQCVQRLEESRRMRLGYLATFPDVPHTQTRRQLSERYLERFGNMNANAAFLFGLYHEVGHYAQLEAVKQQALAGKTR
ncbi:MAG: DinB family protein [Armatimonadetes bacterium]|nr:DinB family protein [Anaerolineae bacterium]